MVVGVNNRIEVWPRDRWEAHIAKKTAEQDELAKRALVYQKKAPAPEQQDSS